MSTHNEYLRHIESTPNDITLVLEAHILHKGPDIERAGSAELDPDPLAVYRGDGEGVIGSTHFKFKAQVAVPILKHQVYANNFVILRQFLRVPYLSKEINNYLGLKTSKSQG